MAQLVKVISKLGHEFLAQITDLIENPHAVGTISDITHCLFNDLAAWGELLADFELGNQLPSPLLHMAGVERFVGVRVVLEIVLATTSSKRRSEDLKRFGDEPLTANQGRRQNVRRARSGVHSSC